MTKNIVKIESKFKEKGKVFEYISIYIYVCNKKKITSHAEIDIFIYMVKW